MTPLVSIIISAYNTEQYIRQCLNSVINQTFKDFEVIVINDFYSDNTYKIIEEFKQKDDRFTVINSEKNYGLGFARNQGLKVAKGKYITFIDSDDWVKNNYVETLYSTIEKHNADFVSADYTLYNNATSAYFQDKKNLTFYKQSDFYNFEITEENIKKQILLDTPNICVWAKIFKREFLLSNNIYFKIEFFEDNLFIWEVIANSKKFLFIKDSIYYYRLNRKGSFVDTHRNKFIFYNSVLFENLKTNLLCNNIYEKYRREFFSYISIRTFIFMKMSILPYSELATMFSEFREKFYTKDFVLSYEVLNTKSKITLFTFYLCLKYNINYVLILKICNLCSKFKSALVNLIHFKFK